MEKVFWFLIGFALVLISCQKEEQIGSIEPIDQTPLVSSIKLDVQPGTWRFDGLRIST